MRNNKLDTICTQRGLITKAAIAIEDGKHTGKFDVLILDLPALEEGKIKVLTKTTITGDSAKTYMFRGHPTRGGKYFLRAGGDRVYRIDAATLNPIDEIIMSGVTDDVIPTPDGQTRNIPELLRQF
ncbi:MAG: hypothetical protein HY730_07820 [Candidatus Tectomicrobia bacterium]|uniref:Uncharacterized protein n=1 Tax=Tectimicrobiota bacterium TaxID=2528274 RepID=A0A933LR07_UNCTE|nr:hypothetical protein [Candidatus Tectomicrobia bacterium]